MSWTTSETALGRSALVPSSRDLVAASGSPLLRSQGFGDTHRSDTSYHYHRTTTSPDASIKKSTWRRTGLRKKPEDVGGNLDRSTPIGRGADDHEVGGGGGIVVVVSTDPTPSTTTTIATSSPDASIKKSNGSRSRSSKKSREGWSWKDGSALSWREA